jgi:hypothetical protein
LSYLSLCELFEPARDDSFCASNNKFSLICILDERSLSANELIIDGGGKTGFSSAWMSIHESKKKYENFIYKKKILFYFT